MDGAIIMLAFLTSMAILSLVFFHFYDKRHLSGE
jgi:hypothetical protein